MKGLLRRMSVMVRSRHGVAALLLVVGMVVVSSGVALAEPGDEVADGDYFGIEATWAAVRAFIGSLWEYGRLALPIAGGVAGVGSVVVSRRRVRRFVFRVFRKVRRLGR